MAASNVAISIPELKIEHYRLYLIGTAPLIVHAFHEKARKEMLDKQMKKGKRAKVSRDPGAEVIAARYILPDGRDGFPSIAFKTAAVTACTSLADVTKVAARQAFRVEGIAMNNVGLIEGSFVRTALVPLVVGPPTIREDICRLSGIGRTPEVRYRPEYWPWGVEISVLVNAGVMSGAQIATMFSAAGHGVGVGEYRPERNGECGTFGVAGGQDEFDAWRAECGL